MNAAECGRLEGEAAAAAAAWSEAQVTASFMSAVQTLLN